jgi:hypothetical protein
MLDSTDELIGYSLEARDGGIGKVQDFYFDDHAWRVRYLVVATGGWLLRNHVLISPAALDPPQRDEKRFPVKLTKEQVSNSPDIDTDKPVSRQLEESMRSYYGWPSYWAADPSGAAVAPEAAGLMVSAGPAGMPDGDPHLRSVCEVTGYDVRASDRELGIGLVTDFLIDGEDWTVRYIVIRGGGGGGARNYALNPWWASGIDWSQRTMHFGLTADRILSSPEFDPASPPGRDFESRLHEYYGREVY